MEDRLGLCIGLNGYYEGPFHRMDVEWGIVGYDDVHLLAGAFGGASSQSKRNKPHNEASFKKVAVILGGNVHCGERCMS